MLQHSALDHINRVKFTSGINCASNGAKIISLGLRTAVWRFHEVERKVILVRTRARVHSDVRTKTTLRSTSWDCRTAVRRPRDIIFAPFNAQFIPDVLSTLFI